MYSKRHRFFDPFPLTVIILLNLPLSFAAHPAWTPDRETKTAGIPRFRKSDSSSIPATVAQMFREAVVDHWTQITKKTASDASPEDEFGNGVAIDGNTAVIGSPGDDDNGSASGSAYVFERNTGGTDNWGFVKKLVPSNGAQSDSFGHSVAISGDTIIVGAPGTDEGTSDLGSAYIFERDDGGADNWGEIIELRGSDTSGGDQLGFDVSIDGDIAVTGSLGDSIAGFGTGSGNVFERNNGGPENWGEVKKLTASDGAPNDFFGRRVAVSGDTVLVGAAGDSDLGDTSGSAYVFQQDAGGIDNWGEVIKLTASDGEAFEAFGQDVDLDGDLGIVGLGSGQKSNSAGAAYIFSRNAGGPDNWGEVAILTAFDGANDHLLGSSVSIDGNRAVACAPGNATGACYIFLRNAGGADNWGEMKKLVAANGSIGERYGWSVAIHGVTVFVGSPWDDPAGPMTEAGKSSGQDRATLTGIARHGAAYVFESLPASTTTFATITGRVTDQSSAGIAGAFVLVTEQDGTVKGARTNGFGYFRFTGIPVSQGIRFDAYAKGLQFTPLFADVSGDLSGIQLQAIP